MKDFNYEDIEAGYYHKTMLNGGNIQRFWHRKKFEEISKFIPHKTVKVLDLGCGPGSFFYVLREKNKKAILYGIDVSKKQIDFASKLVKSASFCASDAIKIPFKDDTFDYVTLIEVIEHLNKNIERNIFNEIKRVLKKNGKIIITTPNYQSLWPIIELFWNKISPLNYEEQHINKKTVNILKNDLIKAGFKVNETRSLFLFSPFISLFSNKFAHYFMIFEKKIINYWGYIILIEAKVSK